MIAQYKSIPIFDPSQPGEARRWAGRVAHSVGMSEGRANDLSIVVTEAAGNLLKHAGQGEILLCPWIKEHNRGVDVIAIDKGPGIADMAASMRDGHSTAGSPGTGLGAISRLASTFDLYSVKGNGTVLFARISERPPGHSSSEAFSGITADCFGMALAVANEPVSGDAFAVYSANSRCLVMLVDGLGHGQGAAEAAEEAVALFEANRERSPAQIVSMLHDGLKKTRGAAVAIAELRSGAEQLYYCGVGNIAATVLEGGSTRSLMSHNGTVGHNAHKIAELTYPFGPNATLVMHSDGLSSHWSPASYSGLLSRPAPVIAALLYRDHRRVRDDASIFVLRQKAA